MKLKKCYQRLELSPDATATEIRQAYKRLVKNWHPDKFEANTSMKAYAEERLKIINAAYDFLCKNQSFTKTSETIKKQNRFKSTFQTSIYPYGIFRKTSLFRRQLSVSLKNILIFLKKVYQPSDSNFTSSNQTGKAASQKVQKSSKQYPDDLKESTSKLGNSNKKRQNGFKTIYTLRKRYGPRPKKRTGPISEVASLDKNQAICSVRRITPIRSIN